MTTSIESLAQIANLLVYSAMAAYTIALVAFVWDLAAVGTAATSVASVSGNVSGSGHISRKGAGIGTSVATVGALLHVAAVVIRGVAASRSPWGNMYEFAVAATALTVVVWLVLVYARGRSVTDVAQLKDVASGTARGLHDIRLLGTFVVGAVLLSLGLSISVLYTQTAELVPALQSYWLWIHVPVAVISTALFGVAFFMIALEIVKRAFDKREVKGRLSGIVAVLPPAERLEQWGYRLNAIAFPLWAFTLVAGAIWAEAAWGRYWGWDPKEVWTFVIFVVYAAYLHARATTGWNKYSAWLAVAGFVCLIMNFAVVNVFFNGLHSYAGIG